MSRRLSGVRGWFMACGVVSCLSVAACGDGQPDGWPRSDHGVLGVGGGECPDLSGTYRLTEIEGRMPAYSQSVFERNIRNEKRRYRWETMTIEGRTRDSLVLTLKRRPETLAKYRASITESGQYYEARYQRMMSPVVRWNSGFARMTDREYEENLDELYLAPQQTLVLKWENDYRCADGWLSSERLVHDPGPDPMRPRPDTVIGVVYTMRDTDGRLQFKSEYPEDVQFSLWCGDGCRGVPLGTWTMHEWARLDTTTAPEVERPRPWAEPFDEPILMGDEATSARWAPMQTPDEIRALLAPLVPAPLAVVGVERAGSQYRATIRSPTGTEPFTTMFEPIARSFKFGSVQSKSLRQINGGLWEMTLALSVQSTNSATPVADIEQRLRSIVPRAVLVERVKASGAGFLVTITTPDRTSYGRAIRAIEGDAWFVRPDVYTATQRGAGVQATLFVRETVRP